MKILRCFKFYYEKTQNKVINLLNCFLIFLKFKTYLGQTYKYWAIFEKKLKIFVIIKEI